MKKKDKIKQLEYQVEALTHKIALLTGEKEGVPIEADDAPCLEEKEPFFEWFIDICETIVGYTAIGLMTLIAVVAFTTPIWMSLLAILGFLKE